MERLVSDGMPPGGLVYDPFAGAGSTLAAAANVGMDCNGMELEPKYVSGCLQRIVDIGFAASFKSIIGRG